MTQKQALFRALSFAQLCVYGDKEAMIAARATCVISWLHDMNWNTEAEALESKVRSSPSLAAFKELAGHAERMAEIQSVASFLNCMYSRGVKRSEWRAARGEALVEELWAAIRMTSQMPVCIYHHDHAESQECVFHD